MTSFKKKSTMIATLVAIISMTMGFAPLSYSATTGLSLNIAATCTVTFPVSAPELDDDSNSGTPITPGVSVVATSTINVANTDQGTQPIYVDVDGGFGDTGGKHIPESSISVLATPSFGSVAQTEQTMQNGVPKLIVALEGQDNTDITFNVRMDPDDFLNQPVSGPQTATATFLLDPCQ